MSNVSSGFVINEIALKGFMRYRELSQIPFREKFTVITGPTGSGKTSILDAITFALYGRSSRTDEKLKIEDFVENDGFVQLDFVQNGQEFQVLRGRNNGRNFLALKGGSQKISGTTPELEQRIEDLVGLDYTGFVNATFVRQDEMKHIGSETVAHRLEIFERLFRLEIFERAQEIADKKLRSVENQSISSLTELAGKQREYEIELPKERERLRHSTTECFKLEKQLKEIEEKKAEQKALVHRLEKEHKDYENVTRNISDTSEEIEILKHDLGEAEEKSNERAKLKREAEKLKGSSRLEKKLLKEKNSLEFRSQKAKGFIEKIKIHQDSIDRIKIETSNELSDVRKEEKDQQVRLKLVANALSKKEVFELLRLDGALRERIARITKEVDWLKEFSPSLVESLKLEQEKASTEALKVKSNVKKINGDSFLKDEIESELNRISDRLNAIDERSKKNIQHELSNLEILERQFKKIRFYKVDSDRLNVIRTEIKLMEKNAEVYDKYVKRLEEIPDQNSLAASLRKKIERLEAELEINLGIEKGLQKQEETYSKTKIELETLQDNISSLGRVLGEERGKMGELDKNVKELVDLGPKIEALRKEIEEFNQQKEIFTILKEEIFHRKGLLVFAIKQLMQGISIEASQILGDLTDQRLNNVRIIPSAETRGGALFIDVEGVDGLFRDVSTFSGGEKTQINAAMRFAIAKELARMPQIDRSYGNMKTLFIDEGDLGSLDTESARIFFVRKLMNLGDLFERIILITHITEVAEQFQNRIRVYMTPERNSRVELGGIAA